MGLINVGTLASNGDSANATDFTTPINIIVNDYNGNIDNNNIKAAAGIVDTKLAQITTPSKVSTAAITGTYNNWVVTTLTVTNKAVMGSGTPAGSMSPLEIVGSDGGLAITASDTGSSTEAYVAGFNRDGAGTYRKLGAMAFQFADRHSATGLASWNVHVTKLTAGTAGDTYLLAGWADNGVSFFPTALGTDNAPGASIVRINNGTLQVGTIATIGVDLTVNVASKKDTIINVDDSDNRGIKIINSNTGTNAYSAIKFKNSGTTLSYIGLAGANLATYANLTSSGLSIYTDNVSGIAMLVDEAGPITFGTNKTQQMMISSAGNVGIGTTPNALAILDVASTTKAVLLPRMSTTERDAISTPVEGMVIYNTSTHVLNFYNGSLWGAV